MPTLGWIVTGALAVMAAFWLVILVDFLAHLGDYRFVEPTALPGDPPTWPRVTVIAPARDEAAHVERCLESLLGQQYANFRVFLVDDQSADRTRELAESLARGDGRLTVIAGRERPDGWAGKNWAVHQGVLASLDGSIGADTASPRGEVERPGDPPSGQATRAIHWFLFTDSDMVHHPLLLQTLVGEAQRRRVDLVSFSPWPQRCENFWQALMVVGAGFLLNLGFPMHRVNNPRRRAALAAGGCLFIKSSVYRTVGGHEALRASLIEDLHLAGRVKGAGHPIAFLPSAEMCHTHIYGGLRDIWNGMRKNTYAAFNFTPWQALLAIAGLVGLLIVPAVATLALPGAVLAGALPADWWWPAGLAALNWLLPAAYVFPFVYRLGVWWLLALSLPFSTLIGVGIMLTAMYDYHLGGGARWKGRQYRLKSAKVDA